MSTSPAPAPSRPERERSLNLPNAITVARLVIFMPLFVLLVLVWHDNLWALIVLVALGSTDWLDGFLARRWNQVTRFGTVVDPIADRASQVVVIITLVVAGIAPLWMALAIAVTDIIVGSLVLGFHRTKSMTATKFGKARTALLMVGFPVLLFANTTFASTNLASTNLIDSGVLLGVAYWVAAAGCIAHAVAGIQYARQIVLRMGE